MIFDIEMEANFSISPNFINSQKESMKSPSQQELPEYRNRPFYFPSRHLETIIPSVAFSVNDPGFKRERLELDDGDFS